MKDFDSRLPFKPSFSDNYRYQSHKNAPKKRESTQSNKLIWKEKKHTQSEIRMMTTRHGVSEKIIHEQPCRVLESCGSCPYLDLTYKNQLIQKTQDLKLRLNAVDTEFSSVIVKDCVASEDRFGYRHVVKLIVSEHGSVASESGAGSANAKRWIDLGFYHQSRNQVIDIGRCPIQTNSINDIVAWLHAAIRTHQITIYTPRNRAGLLKNIIFRASRHSKQVQIVLQLTKPADAPLRALARELAEKFMYVQGIFAQVTSADAKKNDASEDSEFKLLVGQKLLEESYNDLIIKLSVATFLPVNPLLTANMYNRILGLSELNDKEIMINLNSGCAGIAMTLAREAKQVFAIDPSPSAIDDANRNAKQNGFNNISFHQGAVTQTLSQVVAQYQLQHVDVVVMNPPGRESYEQKVLDDVCLLNPRCIIYVSSFFDNMIEDLKYFIKQNYKIVFLEPYDMLPGTQNYDVLCYLIKK